MIVTLLGTGTSQGVPLIGCTCPACRSVDYRDKRLRCSVLVETAQTSVCIDSGPDFRQQMLRQSQKRLDALFITHEHRDHLAGLDDVRAFNYLQSRSMPVYGSRRVLDHIRSEFAYAFAETLYPGVPRLELLPVEEDTPVRIGDLTVQAVPVMHARMPVLGFRLGPFTYITDANSISRESMELVRGSEVLVLNALQKEPHISHYTLEQAIEVARQSGVPRVLFTHISHRMGTHRLVSQELPAGFELAFDGQQIRFSGSD